jgi:hypothetical protein
MRSAAIVALVCTAATARADTSVTPAAGAPLISFHTSIGMPPPEDYVIDVRPDGRVDVTVYMTYRRKSGREVEIQDLQKKPRKKTRTATSAELEPLKKLLADAGVAALKSEYKGKTWDVGSYSVSFVDSAGKAHSVSTSMLAFGELPTPLQQLMSETRKLAANLYRSP